jgi:Fe2+ or Zn2+ uptake regulation protein
MKVFTFYRGRDRAALQAMLRDKGFRSTESRLVLLAFLRRSRKPMPVSKIARALTKYLDETNVYRSLEALTGADLLMRSDLRSGGAHYEFAHSHHHHLVCNNCGKTEDVEECIDAGAERRILEGSQVFASINTHALEFFGTCRTCIKQI